MNSSLFYQITGTVEASDNISDYNEDRAHWLMFDSVQKLSVKGGGTIDGNGNIWWQNSCKTNQKLVRNYSTILLSLINIYKSYSNAITILLCFFAALQEGPYGMYYCSLNLDSNLLEIDLVKKFR